MGHKTSEHRDGFHSKWGFILACIGSAVGMANIWRFPWMVSKYGGLTFLIPYFIFVILIGSTGVIEEFALGRMAGAGPVGAFGACTSRRFGSRGAGETIGALPVIGSMGLAIGYSVVMGWIFKYAFMAINGSLFAMGQDMAILIAGWTVARWGLQGMDLTPKDSGNPLLATWWISGLTFVSYNLFCALGAITPAGRLVPDRKTSVRGIAIGCLLMSAIAGSIQISMAIRPEVTVVDLPMLDLAYMLWPPLGILFAVLLLCGIFGTSLSSVVSVASFLHAKKMAVPKKASWQPFASKQLLSTTGL